MSLVIPSETEMEALGGRLARACGGASALFALQGELGAGKTTLARGFLRALGYRGAVKSPTFTLVEPYELSGIPIYHFDLYRLGDPGELELMGIRDYFAAPSLCLVEWPERGAGMLPAPDVVVHITYCDSGRAVAFAAMTSRGRAVLAAMDAQGTGRILESN